MRLMQSSPAKCFPKDVSIIHIPLKKKKKKALASSIAI